MVRDPYRGRAMTRTRISRAALPLIAAVAVTAVLAQPRGNPFAERMRESLAEPMVGLTTDGSPEPGLFDIEPTGVSTAPVRAAAERFLAALTPGQREAATFPVDDSEWRNWANIHLFPRQGVGFDDMTEAQRAAGYALIEAGLSARGYETSRDIMRLNHHLAELVDDFEEYGEHLYWLTVMGEPSATEPWGWQLDGHHLVVNFFVLGDQIVMTPTFMGSEPVSAESGPYAGTEVMQLEQDTALRFMQSLDFDQRQAAVVAESKRRGENLAEMARDNVVAPYEGLPATQLEADQRRALLDLIEVYVGRMRDAHAAVRMDEVMAHLDETYFAWKGATDADAVFYYRIHSPVIYIEFDHQGPTALAGPRDVATRRHVHSVVRTPNGNDYGKSLLRLHLDAYAGDTSHGHVASAADW